MSSKVETTRENPQHLVQLYGPDRRALRRAVGTFLREGLAQGDSLIVIAGMENLEAFLFDLAVPAEVLDAGRITLLDARATLGRFCVDGWPDAGRFDKTVGSLVRDVARRAQPHSVRAYGEMVGLLWESNDRAAAATVERFWNSLMNKVEFQLFCGYPIDIFDADFSAASLDDLLCAHTHLLPTAEKGRLQQALNRSMDSVLGARVSNIRPLMKSNHRPSWASIPGAEATILWLRNNLPDYADEIMMLAKEYYEAPAT